MDDPNMTMEEYIKLEEKARRRGRVFNWQTATYGKIRVDDDLYDLRSMEAEFPDMALPPREQRHRFFRYERLQYTDADVEDFESRLARIYQREVHRVQVFNFGGLSDLMAEGLSARMLMEHRDDQGVSLFTSRAWRQLFDIRGPLEGMSWREFILALGLYTAEEMQTVGFGAYWADSARQIPDKGDLKDYWIEISSAGDFLDTAPSYTMIQDPILRLCHRYLRLFVAGRKSGAHIYGGKFVARLAEHFGLLTAEILGGLTVIALELPIIDMVELVRLQIYEQLDDTWAWVAMRPERQPDAAAGAPAVAEDAPADDEGDQAILAPVHAPQQLPPPPPAARTMPQRLGRLEEEVQGLRRDVRSLRGLVERSMTDQGRFFTMDDVMYDIVHGC
ncbi:hypothetical protein Tco_0968233 [Tanacetum coccineum]